MIHVSGVEKDDIIDTVAWYPLQDILDEVAMRVEEAEAIPGSNIAQGDIE